MPSHASLCLQFWQSVLEIAVEASVGEPTGLRWKEECIKS